MSSMHLVQLVQIVVDGGLGIALMLGGGILARRSVKAGFWLVISGFIGAGMDLVMHSLRSGAAMHAVRADWFMLTSLLNITRTAGMFGALCLAIYALPARHT